MSKESKPYFLLIQIFPFGTRWRLAGIFWLKKQIDTTLDQLPRKHVLLLDWVCGHRCSKIGQANWHCIIACEHVNGKHCNDVGFDEFISFFLVRGARPLTHFEGILVSRGFVSRHAT